MIRAPQEEGKEKRVKERALLTGEWRQYQQAPEADHMENLPDCLDLLFWPEVGQSRVLSGMGRGWESF